MNELETEAWVNTKHKLTKLPVVACYELDGYKPVGLWISDEDGSDITCDVTQDEYDRIYEQAMREAIEYLTDAADMMEER